MYKPLINADLKSLFPHQEITELNLSFAKHFELPDEVKFEVVNKPTFTLFVKRQTKLETKIEKFFGKVNSYMFSGPPPFNQPNHQAIGENFAKYVNKHVSVSLGMVPKDKILYCILYKLPLYSGSPSHARIRMRINAY